MNKEHEERQIADNVPTKILIQPRVNKKTILIEDEEEDFREYLDIDENNEEEEEEDDEEME